MPFRPPESLLNLNLEKMHTIDTGSVEDLFGLWTVFSKTSNALKDGKRLENMSWRLWNRETFCCRPESRISNTTVASQLAQASSDTIPDLATSLSSIDADETRDSQQTTTIPTDIRPDRPELTRLSSLERRSRPSQAHISPARLEKIVGTIQKTSALEPIEDMALPTLTNTPVQDLITGGNLGLAQSQSALSASPVAPARSVALQSSGSTLPSRASDASTAASASSDSSSTAMSTHEIVRGFKPGGAPSSYRSQSHLPTQPTPILKKTPGSKADPKGKGAMFTLGVSSGDDEGSLESRLYKTSLSSLTQGLHRQAAKKASFRDDNLVNQIQDCAVFESDDEDDDDDDLDEDVIDDDDEDSDEWEDEGDDQADDAPVFFRTESRPNLTSRRSLLTTLMHEGERNHALQNAASRSTPALRRAQTTPPEPVSRAASPSRLFAAPDGSSGSGPRPITTHASSISQHLALSPRTTRRNMLSSELTESLRKNLLWERQHRSSQNVAALKRRHTSYDVKNLRQHPDPQPQMYADENSDKFTNEYFQSEYGEYHSRGW